MTSNLNFVQIQSDLVLFKMTIDLADPKTHEMKISEWTMLRSSIDVFTGLDTRIFGSRIRPTNAARAIVLADDTTRDTRSCSDICMRQTGSISTICFKLGKL